jgi:hypothetical protein
MALSLVMLDPPAERGLLARLMRRLAQLRVDVRGFVADEAGLKLVVDDLPSIESALLSLGIAYEVRAVHEVTIEDRPGALAELLERLSAAGVGIVTAFACADGARGRVFVSLYEEARAAQVLDLVAERHAAVEAVLVGA